MSSIPAIDFSSWFGADGVSKEQLIKQLRKACLTHGFFSLTNHGIPQELFDAILYQSESFFGLPMEVKKTYNKDLGHYNRGYEQFRSQNFEKKTEGDLKEGYYFGIDLPEDHPGVLAKKFGLGPNNYPSAVADPVAFRKVIDTYFTSMLSLAEHIIRALCRTLDLPEDWVNEYTKTPISVLRLLHYPPQAPDASEHERGIGAHTDFGAVTILLQDMVGGLQVWDRASSKWTDVQPQRGALVVNLGNLMMRWTNDRYISNLHRVINQTGKERYSIPFFFSGNPDYIVKCFSPCLDTEKGAKYLPVAVGDWIAGRYADTYGTSKEKAIGELSTNEAAAGLA